MSNFKTPLVVSPQANGKDWKLHTKFAVDLFVDGCWYHITVPANFITDFASIPRILWSIIGAPYGRYGKAALLHDLLYRVRDLFGEGMPHTRRFADRVFLVGMVDLNVKPWRRTLMYWGVRCFGWLAWRKR